jgi:hypothetical protein
MGSSPTPATNEQQLSNVFFLIPLVALFEAKS